MHARFKRRLVLFAMAALVAVLAVLQVLAHATGRRDIQGQLEYSAKGVAVSVAQLLMVDIGEYRAFLETKDPASPYYKKMQRLLATIRDESGIVRYIYTERRLDGSTTEYILDAEPAGSPHHSPPGKLEGMDPEKERVFAEKVYAGNMTDDDKWGKLITSYAPILDEGGEVLGLVGVDIDGRHLDRQFRRINLGMAAASLVIACLSLALLLRFSDAILDYMFRDRLTRAFTRGRFERELGSRIAHSAKHSQGLALMMVEPDSDAAAGRGFHDRVLAHVSGATRDSIRPDDCLARYGHRGLALIVADTGSTKIAEVAERLRQTIEGRPMPDGDGGGVRVAVSIGAAVAAVGQSLSAGELVGSAERALAEAKARGNSVVVLGAGEPAGGAG
jgi:diguanylate cyclase (GGDEF)-like protein